ncbi:MAG: hypothetical protein AAF967_01495 [Pseudomonadota bacterium]
MSSAGRGAIVGLNWAFTFVILEAAQAVFFGSLFQRVDSFLIGALVFGSSAAATLFYSWRKTPDELAIAWANRTLLLVLNASTTAVWIAYFFALQMIEPAVVFTLFSGLLPIGVLLAARLGVPEASPLRNRIEASGLLVALAGMAFLAVTTLLGSSGFVRGGNNVAGAGLALTVLAAESLVVMMIVSQRLDRRGVGAVAQYGLRFPLYVLVASVAVSFGLDQKDPLAVSALVGIVLVGLVLIAFPVFAMQKAITLMSTLSLAFVTALGPAIVFLLQLLDGRVAYATATLGGLILYSLGAVLAAWGASMGTRRQAA